jgi:G3E family GTPase
VAEPRKIRDLFQEAESNEIALLDKMYLDTFITIVDSTTFYNLAKSEMEATNTVPNHIIPNAMNLLVEQVEVADLILVNKCDLLETNIDEKVEMISTFIANINPAAKIISCVNSNVEEQLQYLCYSQGQGVASFGILDEHKNLVESVKVLSRNDAMNYTEQNDHHDHHDHDHHHDNENKLGVGTFVYQRRKPFHPQRFSSFLQRLDQISWKRISDLGSLSNGNDINNNGADDGSEKYLLKRLWTTGSSLFRVKGFVWVASSSVTAYYMSYAGGSLELSQLGKWWSAIPRSDWPEVYVDDIERECEGIYGDRRQEIVFIYSFGNDESKAKRCLENALDDCLLTEEEMKEYKFANDDVALRKIFF